MPPDLFGPIFIPNTLVAGAENLLRKFFPLYLAELETRLELGVGELKIPSNYTQRNTFTSLPGEELPKCVVLVPGMIGPPSKSGGRIYRGTWRLGVGIAVAANTEEQAVFLAEVYGAAARAIIVHHPDIGGVASNSNLIDESYDDLPVQNEIQKFRSASVWFEVFIDNVITKMQGPPDPEGAGPNDARGTANEVLVELDKLTNN